MVDKDIDYTFQPVFNRPNYCVSFWNWGPEEMWMLCLGNHQALQVGTL